MTRARNRLSISRAAVGLRKLVAIAIVTFLVSAAAVAVSAPPASAACRWVGGVVDEGTAGAYMSPYARFVCTWDNHVDWSKPRGQRGLWSVLG